MQTHTDGEHLFVDTSPLLPILRAYLTISRDGHGVSHISGEEGRHVVSGVARTTAPHFFYPIRTFLDTFQHKLITRPALVAFRHVVLYDTHTPGLYMKVYTFTHTVVTGHPAIVVLTSID
jgi:hypothetical protein